MDDKQKQNIAKALKSTYAKRKLQNCKVYTVKIDKSKLNNQQNIWINKIWLEAKWFYNYAISRNDLFVFDTKLKNVKVLNKEGKIENRKLEYLSSHMKQELHARILDNIKGLSILKKKGYKVGRIKYTKNINSIPLKQYKNTWKFVDKNRIKIQGLKKPLYVNGLKQIPESVDFANATLIRKASGYYIAITTYEYKQQKIKTGKEVGLDFGIKNNITTSDGEVFNVKVPETDKLKNLQRHFNRKKKGSKQRQKVLKQIKKEYEHITNIKKDKTNKIIHHLTSNYDNIYIQDEMIKEWHQGLFGKQVQNSAMGAIKSKLKSLESVSIVSKSYPTTKKCYQCGKINKISLSERIYKCDCGLEEDRDVKAAKTIILAGKHKMPPTERRSTLLENDSSVIIDSNIDDNKNYFMKEEDHSL